MNLHNIYILFYCIYLFNTGDVGKLTPIIKQKNINDSNISLSHCIHFKWKVQNT